MKLGSAHEELANAPLPDWRSRTSSVVPRTSNVTFQRTVRPKRTLILFAQLEASSVLYFSRSWHGQPRNCFYLTSYTPISGAVPLKRRSLMPGMIAPALIAGLSVAGW